MVGGVLKVERSMVGGIGKCYTALGFRYTFSVRMIVSRHGEMSFGRLRYVI